MESDEVQGDEEEQAEAREIGSPHLACRRGSQDSRKRTSSRSPCSLSPVFLATEREGMSWEPLWTCSQSHAGNLSLHGQRIHLALFGSG